MLHVPEMTAKNGLFKQLQTFQRMVKVETILLTPSFGIYIICISSSQGWGTLIFSSVGLDLASTVYPKQISGLSSTPKIICNFSNPKNIPTLYLDLKKGHLKCVEMTPKTSRIFDGPKKYSQNLHTPKNIHFSEKKTQSIEIQNFEPSKTVRAYVYNYENIRVPPRILLFPNDIQNVCATFLKE